MSNGVRATAFLGTLSPCCIAGHQPPASPPSRPPLTFPVPAPSPMRGAPPPHPSPGCLLPRASLLRDDADPAASSTPLPFPSLDLAAEAATDLEAGSPRCLREEASPPRQPSRLRSRLRLRSPSSSRGRTHKVLRRASRPSEPSSHDQPRSGAEVVVGSRFACGGGRESRGGRG
jgi:hypothetical protein